MAGGLGMQADMSSFNAQVRDLSKRFPAVTKKILRAAVAESGAELLADMKARASWSKGTQRAEGKQSGRTSIPDATSLTASFGPKNSRARIKVDAKKAPHARGLELGNSTTFDESVINANGGFKTGRDGKRYAANRGVYAAMRKTGIGVGRQLKHPVYGKGPTGSWAWAAMPLRPFFFAAVEAREPGIDKKFEAALTQIVAEAGFKGA